jgi:cell division protein FtsB
VVWGLIGAAIIITLALNFYPAWTRLTGMRSDLAKQKERLAALKKETQDHEREVGLLQSDPQYLEIIARDKLDLMKDGEKIFRFPTNQQTQDQKSQ